MAQIPPSVAATPWHQVLFDNGFCRIHSGKVRDTYDAHGARVQVATDRISIFDFVLPTLVPDKGEILTALTVFWLWTVLKDMPSHLIVHDRRHLSAFLYTDIVEDYDLWKRAVVVKPLRMVPYELIVRGYVTGSGWKSYQKTGAVCGHQLPPGLFDGAKLPVPIFTPTTKAAEGHDEHVDASRVTPLLGDLALTVYAAAAEYAHGRGILIADTKFEFGHDEFRHEPKDVDDPTLFELADEVLTPDSSRFWDEEEWNAAIEHKRTPPAYDKEVVRQWGKTVPTPWGQGIHELDPLNNEHVAFVHSLEVPQEVLMETSRRYHLIFERLVGSTLRDFQDAVMG